MKRPSAPDDRLSWRAGGGDRRAGGHDDRSKEREDRREDSMDRGNGGTESKDAPRPAEGQSRDRDRDHEDRGVQQRRNNRGRADGDADPTQPRQEAEHSRDRSRGVSMLGRGGHDSERRRDDGGGLGGSERRVGVDSDRRRDGRLDQRGRGPGSGGAEHSSGQAEALRSLAGELNRFQDDGSFLDKFRGSAAHQGDAATQAGGEEDAVQESGRGKQTRSSGGRDDDADPGPGAPVAAASAATMATNKSVAEMLRAKLKGLPLPEVVRVPVPSAAGHLPGSGVSAPSDQRTRHPHPSQGGRERGAAPILRREGRHQGREERSKGRRADGSDDEGIIGSSSDDAGEKIQRGGRAGRGGSVKRQRKGDFDDDDDDGGSGSDDSGDGRQRPGGSRPREVVALPLVDAQGRAAKGAFGREAAGSAAPAAGGGKPKKVQRRGSPSQLFVWKRTS